MMGTLIDLGKGKLSLEDIEMSLKPKSEIKMNYIAPASGLILNSIEFYS
jgi:tRNA pseudouridine38-40 synthase